MKKTAIKDGIMVVKKRVRSDIEKTLDAGIPNREKRVIKVASRVPRPFIVIGIKLTIVPKGRILKKYKNGRFMESDRAIK